MKQPSIDEITGHLAVGSVLIGGAALVVQSFSDVKAFLAWLTGLAAWGVIMAIPVMLMSYVTVTRRWRKRGASELPAPAIWVARANNRQIAGAPEDSAQVESRAKVPVWHA